MGNDDVNTFYGDVIVAYSDLDVGNGIAQSVYYKKTTASGAQNVGYLLLLSPY